MGGRKTEPAFVRTVWGKPLRPRIRDGQSAGSANAVAITQGILLRRATDIQKGWQVIYQGQKYEVKHVDNSVDRETTLTCVEVIR